MAVLINRNPCGRLICLHALTQTLNAKFGIANSFTINNLKYDENESVNITDHCTILIKPTSSKKEVCPYLENPISKAKCYLTQSIQHDTQKSKSASDALNALDGLGFVKRNGNNSFLTNTGIKFAQHDFSTKKWLEVVRNAVLSYGPFIGLLYEISRISKKNPIQVEKGNVRLGYPQTKELISHKGKLIQLSTGSKEDTVTRTMSILFSWAVTTGFAHPLKIKKPNKEELWHVDVKEFVNQKKWMSSKYNFYIPPALFNGEHLVNQPLHYEYMTKSTKALRERGQEDIRQVSLEYEPKVNNRRFAIVYGLAKCAQKNKQLDFKKFASELMNNKELFVVNSQDFSRILTKEASIAIICGIPFDYTKGIMKPLTKINIGVLKKGAPNNLIQKLDDITTDVMI